MGKREISEADLLRNISWIEAVEKTLAGSENMSFSKK